MQNPKKKILFAVQGEGRGHMTQSIAMSELIRQAGMEVCAVLIGKSPQRQIPDFYFARINAPVTAYDSPNFITDAKRKAIRKFPTVVKNLLLLPAFRKSLKLIDQKLKEQKPDLIINFYEPLIGLYYLFYKPKIPMVCVAHQYFYHHPDFRFPGRDLASQYSLKVFNNLTAYGSSKKLALSFYPFNDSEKHEIVVIPPLIREAVYRQPSSKGSYILVYLVNSGYLEDINAWHRDNSSMELHCFSDRKSGLDVEEINENLFYHKLNDQKFIEMLGNCKGIVCTAGFETVCEALYLGKPVFTVPVEGQYEQFCNSRDAFKAGAGIYDKKFDITRFLDYLVDEQNTVGYNSRVTEKFRDWANCSATKTIGQIIAAARFA